MAADKPSEQKTIDLRSARDAASARDSEHDTQVFSKRRLSERLSLPTLRVVAGPDLLRFCSIYPGERVIIGRDEECQLPLADPSVSRRHAAVTHREDGTLTIEDLGSTNGTNYEGQPVTASVELRVGTPIQVGSVTLRLDLLGMEELTHLARVVERLNVLSRDSLTGLLGRHFIDNELPAQVARYHRAHIPIAAVFLDVDHFKTFNDRFGHAMGDEVLRTVARLLVMSVRDSDSIARYGGEEFVVVLPNCDLEGAMVLAERIRNRIRDYDWGAHMASVGGEQVADLKVTVSLGVCPYDGGDVVAWLSGADAAMYEAKRGGRDRVCAANVPR